MFKKREDVFEEIDTFDEIDLPKLKDYEAPPKVNVSLNEETKKSIEQAIASTFQKEIAKILQLTKEQTKIIETKIIEKPEKVIIQEKPIDLKVFDDKIKKAIDQYEASGAGRHVFIAPLSLPKMENQSGKVLSNDGVNPKWITSTGGSSSDVYTPANVTTRHSFDATDTSLDELANTLGSLIASLQGAGIIQ